MKYGKQLGAAVGAVALAAGTFAAPAWGAQQLQPLDCGFGPLTIRANNNNSSEHGGWSAAQIVDGGTGHLIPTVFSGSLYDSTLGREIFSFSQTKGGGHANHQQQTVSCTQEQSGTLADFLEPGDTPPPGSAPTDQVTFTITATAVHLG